MRRFFWDGKFWGVLGNLPDRRFCDSSVANCNRAQAPPPATCRRIPVLAAFLHQDQRRRYAEMRRGAQRLSSERQLRARFIENFFGRRIFPYMAALPKHQREAQREHFLTCQTNGSTMVTWRPSLSALHHKPSFLSFPVPSFSITSAKSFTRVFPGDRTDAATERRAADCRFGSA